MTTPLLHARNLSAGYGGDLIVQGVDLDIYPGRVTTVIGANGCGKSTLLKSLARILPHDGELHFRDKPITQWSLKSLARHVSMLPQQPITPPGVTVEDLVGRGRYPHQKWYAQWSKTQSMAVEEAMELAQVTELRGELVDSLSGGQRQRVWIAMILAQDTEVILLDEPTTYLDLAHCVEVLDLVKYLNTDCQKTVVMVLHDLNLAARYSHELLVMKRGRLVSKGSPDSVLTQPLLEDVFGLDAAVIEDPFTAGPLIVPALQTNKKAKAYSPGQKVQ